MPLEGFERRLEGILNKIEMGAMNYDALIDGQFPNMVKPKQPVETVDTQYPGLTSIIDSLIPKDMRRKRRK